MSSKDTPLLGLYGWSNLLKSVADKHDLSVSFDNNLESVKIKGNQVRVPVPHTGWKQKHFDKVLFAVDSYGSMWRYGADAFDDFKELPPDKPLGWMMREFESIRTMREASTDFKGSKAIMSEGIDDRLKHEVIPKLPKMDPKVQSILQAGAESSIGWNEGYSSNLSDIMNTVLKNAEAASHLSKLDSMNFRDRMNSINTPKDSLKLAKDVFELLWEEDPDKQEQKERAEGKGQGKGKGGKDKGEGSGDAPVGLEGKDNEHSTGDQMQGGISDGNSEEGKGPPCDIKVLPPQGREPTFEDPSLLNHVDLKKVPDALGESVSRHARFGKPTDDMMGATSNAMFANKMRRLIMVRSQSYYTHGHRKGKLSTRSIYKLACDHPMPGEDRMFRQKHESDVLDTVVSLCVDYSGSMAGRKTQLTVVAVDLLVNALQVLHVPCEVSMFTTHGPGTHVITVKHFDERINSELLLERSMKAARRQSNNNDAAAVLFKYERVKRRPEKRKILMVLSDGSPATHNVANPQEGLVHVIKGIVREGQVEIMGLGLQSDSVKHYYDNYQVAKKAGDIPLALIKLVQDKMLSKGGE